MATQHFHRVVDGRSVAFPYLVEPNFVADDACDRLIEYFRANVQGAGAKEGEIHNDWAGRIIWESHIHDEWVRNTMRDAATRIAAGLQEVYGTTKLYDDGVQLVRWPEGTAMPTHADNAFPNGDPHDTPWRDHAAILYLNDDFEEGQFYFDGTVENAVIKPTKGTLVAFGGGFDYAHGVIAPRGADRITMASWYTSTPEARR